MASLRRGDGEDNGGEGKDDAGVVAKRGLNRENKLNCDIVKIHGLTPFPPAQS